jgi:hypothetical protein
MIIITSMHSQRATKLHQWNLNHPPLRRPGVPGHTPVGSTSVIVTHPGAASATGFRQKELPTRSSLHPGATSATGFRQTELGTQYSPVRGVTLCSVIPGPSQPPGPQKVLVKPHNRPGSAGSDGRKNPYLLCKYQYPKVTLRDCPSSGLLSLSEVWSSAFAKHNGTPLSALVRACRKLHRGSRALHKGIVRPASQPSVYTRAVTPLSLTRRTPSRGRSA